MAKVMHKLQNMCVLNKKKMIRLQKYAHLFLK